MSILIIKSGTTSIEGATVKGDFTYFSATTKGLGATIDTGFWSGVDPTCEGYTVYKIGGQNGWAAMVATGREQLNEYLKLFGGTGTTTDENVTWATNADNIFLHSGSTGPCITPTPTPSVTPPPTNYYYSTTDSVVCSGGGSGIYYPTLIDCSTSTLTNETGVLTSLPPTVWIGPIEGTNIVRFIRIEGANLEYHRNTNCVSCVTPTPTSTETPTTTPTLTATPTPTDTPISTETPTLTSTPTQTQTSTQTQTQTSTQTPTTTTTLTSTPTQTSTQTPTQTSTQTPTTTTTLTATPTQTSTQTPTQTPTPIGCTSYTVSTTSATGQSFTYTDCDGTPTGGNIGGASGFDAETFCAQTGTVDLVGVELTLTINGPCSDPTPSPTPTQTKTPTLTATPTQTPTTPSECTSYTVSTTSANGQSFTYTDCDGTETGGNIGGASGFDAETFCARTGTVNLIGVELTLTINGVCFLPTPTATPSQTATQTATPSQTATLPPECTSYTVSTTSATGQSFTYTDCDGTPTGGNIGGSSGYEAETFCARTGTVNLIGVELTLTINGACFLPTPTQTPSHTPSPTPTTTTLNIDVQTNASLDITLTKITVNGVIATVAGGVWPNTSGNGASLFVNLPEGTYDVIIDYTVSTPGQHIEISSPITGPACQNTISGGLSSLTFLNVGMSSTTPLSVLAADGTC